MLKIGGTRDNASSAAAGAAATRVRYEVSREAHGAAAVWGAIMDAVKGENEEEARAEWEIILDSADMLRSMTESLLGRLPRAKTVVPDGTSIKLRGDVDEMIGNYVSGQREVLQDLLQYAYDREMGGVAAARQQGIVIQLEDQSE